MAGCPGLVPVCSKCCSNSDASCLSPSVPIKRDVGVSLLVNHAFAVPFAVELYLAGDGVGEVVVAASFHSDRCGAVIDIHVLIT